jgi:hypothetical protein
MHSGDLGHFFGTKDVAKLDESDQVILCAKERHALAEKAEQSNADRPDIDGSRLSTAAKKHFRRLIVSHLSILKATYPESSRSTTLATLHMTLVTLDLSNWMHTQSLME